MVKMPLANQRNCVKRDELYSDSKLTFNIPRGCQSRSFSMRGFENCDLVCFFLKLEISFCLFFYYVLLVFRRPRFIWGPGQCFSYCGSRPSVIREAFKVACKQLAVVFVVQCQIQFWNLLFQLWHIARLLAI